MLPLAQVVIVACVVVLTAALVSTLLALRKTALRAESVLQLVEREILPMASQIESLSNELRTLSRHANDELERVGVVVRRVEELSGKVARLLIALSGFTRAGQVVGIAAGVRRTRRVLQALKDKH
jgi:uncharacterized protein YoxC